MSRRQVILIVEDNHDLRGLFAIALSFAGFDVHEARTGFEALRFLDTDPPDLVVLDLGLPGIDGYAVQQEIAANAYTRHIPIVIVTASAKDLSHLDVACVLRKPVAPEELVVTVRKCLATGAPIRGA